MDLITALSPEQCRERLAAAMDGPFALLGSRPLVGIMIGQRLWAKKQIGYANPLRTILRASFSAEDSGTRIRCKFGVNRLVLICLGIWLGFVVLIGGPMFLLALAVVIASPAPFRSGAWPFLIVPPAMICAFWGLVRFGTYLARDERRFLSDFLRRTLDAQVI